MDNRAETPEFLASRRAKLTPAPVGPPAGRGKGPARRPRLTLTANTAARLALEDGLRLLASWVATVATADAAPVDALDQAPTGKDQ